MTDASPRPGDGQTLGQLVGKMTETISALIRDEIQLAQVQIAEKGKAIGVGVGLFAGAGLFGLFGFGWLLVTAYAALAAVLPPWAAALIVAGALLILAAVLALVGKTLMSRAPAPQTKENLQRDIEAMKAGLSS